MNVELSQRALIALEHLQKRDGEKAKRMIGLLSAFPNGDSLRGKYHKVPNYPGNFYIAKATLNLRLIFQINGDSLLVLDIVFHDRLKRMFKFNQGGEN